MVAEQLAHYKSVATREAWEDAFNFPEDDAQWNEYLVTADPYIDMTDIQFFW